MRTTSCVPVEADTIPSMPIRRRRSIVRISSAVALLFFVSSVQAGPLEDAVNRIESNVGNIKKQTDKLNDLPGLVQDKIGVSLDPDVKEKLLEAFGDVRSALDDLQAEQADILTFGDGAPGTGCFAFRDSFKTVLSGQSNLINDVLLSSAASIDPSIGLEINGLTIVQLIDLIPCPALFPVSVALEATPLGDLAKITSVVSRK